jgi:hypothetical protein
MDLFAGVLELLPRPAGFIVSLRIKARPFLTNKAPLESVLRNLLPCLVAPLSIPQRCFREHLRAASRSASCSSTMTMSPR